MADITGEISVAVLYHTSSVEWKICNFFSTLKEDEIIFRSPTFTVRKNNFHCLLYANHVKHPDSNNKWLYLEIIHEQQNEIPSSIATDYFTFKVGIKKDDGSVYKDLYYGGFSNDFRFMKSFQTDVLTMSSLLENRSEITTLDYLTIFFEFVADNFNRNGSISVQSLDANQPDIASKPLSFTLHEENKKRLPTSSGDFCPPASVGLFDSSTPKMKSSGRSFSFGGPTGCFGSISGATKMQNYSGQPFGSSASTFGATTTQNNGGVFGSGASTFGTTTTKNNGGVFGSGASTFGTTTTKKNGGVFGSGASTFGTTTTQNNGRPFGSGASTFGTTTTQNNGIPFGSSASTFGATTSQNYGGLFGSGASTFGVTTTQNYRGLFGCSASSIGAVRPTLGGFGSTPSTTLDQSLKNEDLGSNALHILSKKLEDMFTNELHCDVTIKIGIKEFRVHKAILAARSPWFAEKFQKDTETEGSNSAILDIIDCDPDVFQLFLLYLYSGKIDKFTTEKVPRLYITACNYGVVELKADCVSYMSRNLSADNFCDIIEFAEKHKESQLLNSSKEYFRNNARKILLTTKWPTLMKESTALANELILLVITP